MGAGKTGSNDKKSAIKSRAGTAGVERRNEAAVQSSVQSQPRTSEKDDVPSPLLRVVVRRRTNRPAQSRDKSALELVLDFLRNTISDTGKTVRLAVLIASVTAAIGTIVWMISLADLSVSLTAAGAALGTAGIAVLSKRGKSK
jgi:hypothetical protein